MPVAHLASVRIDVPANFAFERLSDGHALGRWALGSMGLEPAGQPGIWRGHSLFDGSEAIVEIVAHPELGLIDYHVGDLDVRSPRIAIRVTPGPDWGLGQDACLAAMTTWRVQWMDDARWARTCTTHELEVLLFKAQIETDFSKADA
jgi:hypothetical protein